MTDSYTLCEDCMNGLKRDIATALRQAAKDGITRHESMRVAEKLVDKWIKEGE